MSRHVLRRSAPCGHASDLGKGAGHMAISGVRGLPVEDTLTRRQLRRALVASTIGTTIEWYDFLLYGNATALYLAPLFFPRQNAFLSTLAAYTTFLVGFLVRPLGAAFFGHLGDRVGRKATL